MPKQNREIAKFLIGIALIVFAVFPTPDDVTVISPIIAFSVGVALVTGNKIKLLTG